MSIKYMNDAWDMPGLNSSEKIVLLAIADWANDDGFAYPSYNILSKKTGMALTTLSKCLKVLSGVGILKVTSHGEIGTGKKVNTYAITSRVQLPITSDLLLIEKIKELRKESARPITSSLLQRKLAASCTITSSLQDETPFNTPLKQPSVLKDKVKKGFVLPEWVDKEIWGQWMVVRKAKKQVATEIAFNGLIDELLVCQKSGYEPSYVMTVAVKNSWAGLKLQWVINWENAQKSPNSATNRNSGFAKQPQERPVYTLQGNRGAIDSTAEILHEYARL